MIHAHSSRAKLTSRLNRPLGEERSEIYQTKCMKKCFQKKKNFPRQKKKNYVEDVMRRKFQRQMSSGKILRDEDIMYRNLTQRKFHPAKFPVAKLNAVKISRGEIFCGEITGSEI